jgi:hypothetical protein
MKLSCTTPCPIPRNYIKRMDRMKKVFTIGATSLIVIAISGFSTIPYSLIREQTQSQSNFIKETTATKKEHDVSEETTVPPEREAIGPHVGPPVGPYAIPQIVPPVGPPEGGTEGTLVDKLEGPFELTENVDALGTYIRQIDSASVEIKVDGKVKVFYLLKGFTRYDEGVRIRFSYGTSKDGLNFLTGIMQ